MYADGKYHNKKGYIKVFRYGIGGNVSDVTMQADFAYAMLINQKLAVGMGLGYSLSTITSHTWENLSFGEIFFYSRYYVNDKKKRFFADAKIGAGLQLDSRPWLKYSSGPLFQPGLGFQFATRRKVKWEVGLRQLIQATKIYNHDGFLLRDQIIVNEIQPFQNVLEKRILSRTTLSFSLIL